MAHVMVLTKRRKSFREVPSPQVDDSHKIETLQSLNSQRELKILCDILLLVDNEEFPAHKGVLAANSNYFMTMFTTDMVERQQKKVKVCGVGAKAMEELLDFMYTGQIKIHDGNVRELLQASNYLLVAKAKQACCRYLESIIGVDNCFTVLSIADEFACDDLHTRAANTLFREFLMVAKTEDFLQLPVHVLVQLLSSDDLFVDSEDQMLEVLMGWISYDLKQREFFLDELLKSIRWAYVRPSALESRTAYKKLMSAPSVSSHPRKSYSTVEVIVVAGGCNNLRILETTCCYIPSVDKWCQLDSLNVPRWRLTMASTKDGIYAFGGLCEVSSTEPRIPFIEKYDGRSDSWHPVPHDHPFPEDLDSFGTAAVNSRLFLIGGLNHVLHQPTSSVFAFHLDTDVPHYIPAASMSVARIGHSVVTSGNHVYVLGGSLGASTTDVLCTNSVERYDVNTDTWGPVLPMNQSRCFAASVSIQQRIYVFGGCQERNVLKTAEVYDPVQNEWRPITPMHTPRMKSGVAVLHGKVYLFGGMRDHRGIPLSSVECYIPAEDRWTSLTDMPGARFDHYCCTTGVTYKNLARVMEDE